jgi:hypothetical protein
MTDCLQNPCDLMLKCHLDSLAVSIPFYTHTDTYIETHIKTHIEIQTQTLTHRHSHT